MLLRSSSFERTERTGTALSESASDRVRLGVWGASTLSAYGMYYSLKYATSLVGINSILISYPRRASNPQIGYTFCSK